MNGNTATFAAAPEAALPQEIDELPLAYIEIDAQGRITRANRAAIALNHPEQGELVGATGWDLMAVDEQDSSHAEFHAHLETGDEPPVISRSLFDRSGKFRTYDLHRSLLLDADGRATGMRIVCVDVTEARKARDDAQRLCIWLESALQSLDDAVILTDILGVVRNLNPAAERLTGFTAEELTGQIIEDVVPILAYEAHDGVDLNRRSAIEGHCRGIATLLNRKGGEVKVEINTSPIVDKDKDSVVGVVSILRKISDSR